MIFLFFYQDQVRSVTLRKYGFLKAELQILNILCPGCQLPILRDMIVLMRLRTALHVLIGQIKFSDCFLIQLVLVTFIWDGFNNGFK